MEQPSPSVEAEPVPRRSLLKWATAAVGALLGAAAGVPIVGAIVHPLRKKVVSGADAAIPVAQLARLPEGEPVRATVTASLRDAWSRFENVALGAVWLVRRGEKVTALSTVCPHAGCFVDWEAKKKCFACPCHTSAFDVDGKRVSGPAPRDMDGLDVEVKEGRVMVRWQRFRTARPTKEPA